jgi:magnesium-transporting ATPase (P-type)
MMHGADVSLTVEQRFPLSGVLGNRERAALADSHRARAEAEKVALDVELDAASAFLMLQERRQIAAVFTEQRALAEQLVRAATARYAAGIFIWALRNRNLAEARNLAFFVIVFSELFRSFASRSTSKLFWEGGPFSNLTLLAVVAVSVLIQLGIHHIPATQALFQIGALSMADCALGLVVGLGPVTVVELTKLVRRASLRRRHSNTTHHLACADSTS